MDLKTLSAAIVGGGIGGMAVATALAQRGAHVVLYEQAPALEEVGAGLQVSANGQRVLQALGIDASGVAQISSGTQMRDGHSGRDVVFLPGPAAGATWYVHRADLLTLLEQAARSAGAEIVLDRFVTPGSLSADILIAADGGQSVWRSAVDGPITPLFTGQVAWRALVDAGDAAAPHASVALGSRAHVVTYPLRQGALTNIVAVEERSAWSEEGWKNKGDIAEFRDRFADFHGPEADWIARAKTVHIWALHLRPVAQRWYKDNVVLLGDAAHPTLPFMAQGACLALEDAWVLSDAIEAGGTVADGLSRYQNARRARAEAVVGLAKGNALKFHLPRPWSWAAHMVLSMAGTRMARRLDWVYDYDATMAVRAG